MNARIKRQRISVDFITRASIEWGDRHALYTDAIKSADPQQGYEMDSGVTLPVAAPEHLVAMKIGAATDTDERDAVRLIAKVEDLDVEQVRKLTRKHLGAVGVGRLEEAIRRAGHPSAKRAYGKLS